MKKLAVLAALAAIVIAPQAGRTAGPTAVNVRARIAPPLQIVAMTDLDFGYLLPDGTAGLKTSTVSAAGVETLGAGLTQLGGVAAGTFELRGRGGASVTALNIVTNGDLTCGPDLDPVNDCVGVNTIPVSLPTWAPPTPVGLVGAGLGVATVSFGATISVDGNQASGLYTGTLMVTAAY